MAIDPSKSSETAEPLVEFVSAMTNQDILKGTQAGDDFRSILTVMKAGTTNPMNVSRAVQEIKEAASADRMILATFKAMPQGKRYLDLAEEFAADKVKCIEHLKTLDTVRVECTAFTEAIACGKMYESKMLVDECWRLGRLFADALKQTSDQKKDGADADGQAVENAKKDSKQSLCDFVDVVVATHLVSESQAWIQDQLKSASNDPGWALGELYAWDFFRLRDFNTKCCCDQGPSSMLLLTMAFHDASASLVKAFRDYDKCADRSVATSLCSSFTSWRECLVGLNKKIAESFSDYSKTVDLLKVSIEGKIDHIFKGAWRGALVKPLELFCKLMSGVQDGGLIACVEKLEIDTDGLLEACSQASFLVTGLSDNTTQKADLIRATEFLKYQIDSISQMKVNHCDGDVALAGKTLRALFDTFKIVLGLSDDIRPNVNGNFESKDVKCLFCKLKVQCLAVSEGASMK